MSRRLKLPDLSSVKDVATRAAKDVYGLFLPNTNEEPSKTEPGTFGNGIKITIVKREDLSRQQADVIVCFSKSKLDIANTNLKDLAKAAGSKFVDELKRQNYVETQIGEIAMVKGYKLKCKEVYVTPLPDWKPGCQKIIQKCVRTCLFQANQHTSIMFQALGTENVDFPPQLVAAAMYETVIQFDGKSCSLQEVKFLCNNTETILAFEREHTKRMSISIGSESDFMHDLCSQPPPYSVQPDAHLQTDEVSRDMKWLPAKGSDIPKNAVRGGQETDGKPLFVARAFHNGYWYPGKVGYHLNGCHVGYNWLEKVYSDYEVLTDPTDGNFILSWEKDFCGHVPENAVFTDASLELFVGRHKHDNGIHLGRVDQWNKALFLPYGDTEVQYSDYEVLLKVKATPSGYKLFNVIYDLEKAKSQIDDKPIIMTSQPATNSSDFESQVSVTVSYAKTTTHQWSLKAGLNIGTKLQVEAKVPMCGGTKLTISPQAHFSGSTDNTIQEKVETSANATVKLPGHSSVMVAIVAKKQEVEVPFTASLTSFMSDGRDHTTHTCGIYKGVSFADFQTTISKM